MKDIIDLFRDPSLENIDIDGGNRFLVHSKMLKRKRMLREVFLEFHHKFRSLEEKYISVEGLRIEIGAGVAPIRDTYPDVLATDIVDSTHLDRVLDAENIDLPDRSVRVFYGQNCFHHFPHPDKFFNELNRVIAPGGGLILIEPYYGPFAAYLYKRLFKTEGFDKNYPHWDTPQKGPMNGANQALSYIVFNRDRHKFNEKYPSLHIVHIEPIENYLRYLLSGGLNFRQLLPDFCIYPLNLLEKTISPFKHILALHHIIVLKRV
jgi:SAM-dependent methyltransferase